MIEGKLASGEEKARIPNRIGTDRAVDWAVIYLVIISGLLVPSTRP